MSLPEDSFSSISLETSFVGGRSKPVRDIIDYESGGFDLQDSSRGLLCNIWRTRILGNGTQIVLDAEPANIDGQKVPALIVITGTNITEVSTTFDSNMNPAIAYVEDGTPKLYWFDTLAGMQVTTDYPGIITPRVSLDDKRPMQSAIRDVIFTYIRDGQVYYRQQRDRYTIEYDPTENLPVEIRDEYRALVAASPGIIKCGMMRNLRFGWLFKTPT